MSQLSFPNDFTAGTTISSSQVNANFTAAETWSLTISDDNFSSSAGMYSAYRTLEIIEGVAFGPDQAAATYIFNSTGASTTGGSTTRGIHLDDADFAISGRTTKLRVRASVASNATAAGINFTFGLYPVTVAGAADAITYTPGTVVSGSTAAVNAPSASTVTTTTGSDFSIPADGLYVLGVVTSGLQANNNLCTLHVVLQQRWT